MTRVTTEQLIESLSSLYGTELTAADIKGYCAANDISYPTVTRKLEQFKTTVVVGIFQVTQESVENIEKSFASPAVQPPVEQNLIPQKDSNFVSFGNFTDVKKIIKSGIFYPTFITGLSGNGKTFSVEHMCSTWSRTYSCKHYY